MSQDGGNGTPWRRFHMMPVQAGRFEPHRIFMWVEACAFQVRPLTLVLNHWESNSWLV
jgi:hypothetical protein